METLTGLWGRVTSTVQDPASNLTAALMLAAAVVLFILIVLVLVLAWVVSMGEEETPEQARDRSRRQAEAEAEVRRRWSGPLLLAVLLAALTGTAIAYSQSGRTAACLSCHVESSSAVTAWSESVHASVECWDCHGGSGALGGVSARLAYVRWARPGARAEAPRVRARVGNRACVRCHEAMGLVSGGDLRMSHEEPLAEGYDCISCHAETAHGEIDELESTPSRMALCLVCHDGQRASAACNECHVNDVSQPGGTPPDRFPKVSMGAPTDCRGCHSIKACNDCHGLELPHPVAFRTTGSHALEAAYERHTMCNKCHDDATFCNRCHRFGSGHAGAEWRRDHGPEALRPGGHARCRACHQASEDFCALCHTDDRRGG